MVYESIRIVGLLKPKFFFVENVKEFTNLDRGLFVEEVKKQFKNLDYDDIWREIICAADCGIP